MPRRLNLPDSASVAQSDTEGRLSAPSAQRNTAPLLEVLRAHGPIRGRALELASGTGQHVVAFARALPDLDWQPSEVDPQRLGSIRAWADSVEGGPLSNLRAPIALDATAPGWAAGHGGQDLIVLVNLLHLISTPEARTLIDEAAQALAPGGRFILYGPFLRDGVATSEGDARFDASLRAQDPEIGYKDDADVAAWIAEAGLHKVARVPMPANNLALVVERAI